MLQTEFHPMLNGDATYLVGEADLAEGSTTVTELARSRSQSRGPGARSKSALHLEELGEGVYGMIQRHKKEGDCND